MPTDVILPRDVIEATHRLREAEEALAAARQDAVDVVMLHYAKGLPARTLSNKHGGPFSYLTTLKHVNEGLASTTEEERRHLAERQTSIFS
jgi:hypothetical protein